MDCTLILPASPFLPLNLQPSNALLVTSEPQATSSCRTYALPLTKLCPSVQAINTRSRNSENFQLHEGQMLLNCLRATAAVLHVHGHALLPTPSEPPLPYPLSHSTSYLSSAIGTLLLKPKTGPSEPLVPMWAAGKAASALFRADAVLISPAGSFTQEVEGADLVCFEGVNLTEHLEAEYRSANNRAVPKNQRKSVLQRCMQVSSLQVSETKPSEFRL